LAKWVHRVAITIGYSLLGVSLVIYIVLDRLAAAEQAVSPREDSFGVAVLGMIYGPPIIVTAVGGLLTLLLGLFFLVVHRFQNRD
jgi:hypothetical protein